MGQFLINTFGGFLLWAINIFFIGSCWFNMSHHLFNGRDIDLSQTGNFLIALFGTAITVIINIGVYKAKEISK